MPSDSRALEELRIDRRDKEPRRVPGVVWPVLAAIVLLALAGWWWAAQPSAIEVTTVTVQLPRSEAEGAAVLNASGYVTARRRATVSSKVTGRVVEVRVEEGMAVRQGQVLARLDRTTAERALQLAEAELQASRVAVTETRVRLEHARLTRGRSRQLRTEGITHQADLDAAEGEVLALEARLALAEEQVRVAERHAALRQTDVADTVITAPFSGVAISKDAQPGEMISPVSAGGGFTRTGICTIVDMGSLEIEVDVNESYINRVTAGQRVEATLDAYPDWRIPAHVITLVPTADRQKATVLVRIGFEALDPRILPDMGVKVAFLDSAPAATAAPVMTIPAAALRSDGGGTVVFVVADGRAERRAVRTGAKSDARVEILSGLTAGDRVVLESSEPLADGVAVAVK